MTKSKTLNAANCPDLVTDLDIVCKRWPGRGAALKRLLGYAGVKQSQLAEALGVDHASVSYWISEKNNPSYTNLRKILAFLEIDQNLVIKNLGRLIQTDTVNDVLNARLKPYELKITLEDLMNVCTETDPDKREELIHKAVMEPVVIAQALKAMGGDTRAAQWMDNRQTKLEEKIRLKDMSDGPQRSEQYKTWLSGDVYQKDQTTPPSNTPDAEMPAEDVKPS
jgi:transcriptional regulator with XRE-family HTH domain